MINAFQSALEPDAFEKVVPGLGYGKFVASHLVTCHVNDWVTVATLPQLANAYNPMRLAIHFSWLDFPGFPRRSEATVAGWRDCVDVVASSRTEFGGKNTFAHMGEGRVLNSCSGWLSQYPADSSLPGSSRSQIERVAFALLPDDPETLHGWSRVVMSLDWLQLCRSWQHNAPEPAFDMESVLASYARMTCALGGASILTWKDVDTYTGLIISAPAGINHGAAGQLRDQGVEEDPKLLSRLYGRGFLINIY